MAQFPNTSTHEGGPVYNAGKCELIASLQVSPSSPQILEGEFQRGEQLRLVSSAHGVSAQLRGTVTQHDILDSVVEACFELLITSCKIIVTRKEHTFGF